jgi:hypothetical protein
VVSDQLRDLVRSVGEFDPPLDLHARINARELELATGQRRAGVPRMLVRIAAVAGALLILGALALAAHSREQKAKPAKSTNPAPRPCVVGSDPDCGPLPTVPTSRTPVPRDVHDRGVIRRGLLRPGTYTYYNFSPANPNSGFNLRFTVPAGWTWDGRALSKGGAAIYFYSGPVQVYADPCHWASAQPPTPQSVYGFIRALAAQPMRYATRPRELGLSLASLDLRTWDSMVVRLTVPSNIDFSGCDHGQYRSWGPGRNTRSQQGPGQRDLVWAADLQNTVGTEEPGQRLIIDAATFPDTPTPLVGQVDAILASVIAGHWG